MSQFRVEITILSRNGETSHALEALVDTGAAYSVVPRSLIEFLGYRPVRTQRVILADGRLEEWPVSHVDVECQGRRTTTPVLMSAPGAPVLLGATTLEELGLGVDPLNRRLVPVDLYLASA
jgi:clan AA aspartic protease